MESEVTVVERVVLFDDATFRVQSSTRPARNGHTVFILIHGIGTSHRYLSRLHEELAQDAHVHSLDLPGFGGLPKPSSALGVRGMAAALASVLDHLGVTSAVLVGHSMGAQWVVELAASRPDLAAGVVLIGPVADDAHRTASAQAAALVWDTIGEPLRANAVVLLDYLRCGPVWFLTQLRHMIAYPIEDRVPAILGPLLVIRGGNDPIAGTEWCRRLRSRSSSGSFVQAPGHRHVVQFTAAPAVASAIRAFIARAPGRSVVERNADSRRTDVKGVTNWASSAQTDLRDGTRSRCFRPGSGSTGGSTSFAQNRTPRRSWE